MERDPKSISARILADYLSKRRICMPDVQREAGIWSTDQKQHLIDSLYNNYDIPKIYFRIEKGVGKIWWVLDGQQRLATILDFLNDGFRLSNAKTLPATVHEKYYSELSNSEQSEIMERKLDCVLITCTDDEKEDMFVRLNNGTPLNAAEKRNAIIGIPSKLAKRLSRHKFFRSKVAFPAKRFAHDSVAAQLILITLANGPADTTGPALKRLYAQRRNKFPEKERVEAQTTGTLNRLSRIFQTKEPYLKKFNAVSYFCFCYVVSRSFSIRSISDQDLSAFFAEFERNRVKNLDISPESEEYDSELGRYQSGCVDGPDKENSIRDRHEVLLSRFLARYPRIRAKDRARLFSRIQKLAIYLRAKGLCQGLHCSRNSIKLPYEEGEFDHKLEHSDAGSTNVANGRFLCKPCHRRKNRAFNRKR